MQGLSEEDGIILLRDTMATWYYLMMEKYQKTTRDELLEGYETADDAWEAYMAMHTGCVKYYDKEIELCADFRSRDKIQPENVWESVANIKNISAKNICYVQYAKELIARERKRDYQRRF